MKIHELKAIAERDSQNKNFLIHHESIYDGVYRVK